MKHDDDEGARPQVSELRRIRPTVRPSQRPAPQHDDDEEPRPGVNLAALVFVALLVVGGVWLANVLSKNAKLEDCLMSGRRNCVQIETSQ